MPFCWAQAAERLETLGPNASSLENHEDASMSTVPIQASESLCLLADLAFASALCSMSGTS